MEYIDHETRRKKVMEREVKKTTREQAIKTARHENNFFQEEEAHLDSLANSLEKIADQKEVDLEDERKETLWLDHLERETREKVTKELDELAKRYPEAVTADLSDWERAWEGHIKTEALIEDLTLKDFILRLEFPIDIVEISEKGLVSMEVVHHFQEKRLPSGYGYKGGAARALLNRALGIDEKAVPRDIDIVRFYEENKDRTRDDELAKEFMPDDYELGDGVEVIHDNDSYFATRDYTMNEILATDNVIYCTKQALYDTVRGIIRVTDYEREAFHGVPGSKMLAKAIRLQAKGVLDREYHLPKEDEVRIAETFISPFWLAVQLDRAAEIGQDTAADYLQRLILHKQVPDTIASTEELADYLVSILDDRGFYFRNLPPKQVATEESLIAEAYYEKYGDEYDHL